MKKVLSEIVNSDIRDKGNENASLSPNLHLMYTPL